jgi:hypothetical protein
VAGNRRIADEKGVGNAGPIEDWDIARLDYRAAFSEVDINAILRNSNGPEEAGWRKYGWVQVVDL